MGLFDSVKSKATSTASSKTSGITSKVSSVKSSASEIASSANQGYAMGTQIGQQINAAKAKAASARSSLGGLAGKVGGADMGSVGGLAGGGQSRFVRGQGKKRTEYPDSSQVANEGLVRLENYLFTVEISGIEGAIFEECSGLEIVNSIIELNEGGNNTGSLKFYDRTHYSNIVLRRGVTNDTQLYDWLKTFVEDPTAQEKIDASIVIKTLDNLEISRINLFGVIPVKWSIPKLRANTGYPVEYIELAVEDAKIDDGSGS